MYELHDLILPPFWGLERKVPNGLVACTMTYEFIMKKYLALSYLLYHLRPCETR